MASPSENQSNTSRPGQIMGRSSLSLKQSRTPDNSNRTTFNANNLSFQERHYIDQTTVLKEKFQKNQQKLV